MSAELPVLATVVKGINEPRIPTYLDVYGASSKEILRWRADDIGFKELEIGSKGSPTRVSNIFTPEALRQCEMLSGSLKETCEHIVNILKAKELI